MVWFLLAPLAAYGAKKLYDAVTEPDPPPTPPARPSPGPAKAERTRVRTEAIMDWFKAHYHRVGTGIGQVRLASGLGPVKVDANTPGVVKVRFEGHAQALEVLNSARQCLDGGRFDSQAPMYVELNMPNPVEWRDKLLRKADADYGDMAGITPRHTYDREQDPFLAALRKASPAA